jgi:hypothetical protein
MIDTQTTKTPYHSQGSARMTDARIAMVWYVPERGHRWCDARPIVDGQKREASGRFLVPEPGAWRRYAPLLDTPDVFKRFAELEFPDDVSMCEEHVRRFADQYGPLGIGFLVIRPDGHAGHGEDLATWHQERSLLHIAMQVWDALQAEDIPTLQRWLTSSTAGEQFRVSTISLDGYWPFSVATGIEQSIQVFSDQLGNEVRHMGFSMSTDPSSSWPDWPTGPVQWGMNHLRGWVNRQLELHTSPQLQYVPYALDKRPLQTAIIPKNLLGGLWLQFALVIEGELQYARCAECGTWFRVKPKGNRANTRFCQDYCRVKANRRQHRARKAAARSGRRHGAPVVD